MPFLLLRRSTLIYSFKRYGRLNEQHKLYNAKNSIDLCVCKWNFKLSRHNPYCKTKIFFKKSLFCKLIIYHYSFLLEHYASYRDNGHQKAGSNQYLGYLFPPPPRADYTTINFGCWGTGKAGVVFQRDCAIQNICNSSVMLYIFFFNF